ncbi:MAG TPA: hypothetical protein VHA56_01200 [Mucilaginibacter sp.]|nr:hypothetical protein [Mucilaginibacter sp.]
MTKLFICGIRADPDVRIALAAAGSERSREFSLLLSFAEKESKEKSSFLIIPLRNGTKKKVSENGYK